MTETRTKEPMTVENAIELVTRKWDANGDCQSCGWHACLYEYGHLPGVMTIDQEMRRVELPCLNPESDGGHRGVRIYFDD